MPRKIIRGGWCMSCRTRHRSTTPHDEELAKSITAFEVVELGTDKVVHTVKLQPGSSERHAEKVEAGLLRKVDLERFYVREVR